MNCRAGWIVAALLIQFAADPLSAQPTSDVLNLDPVSLYLSGDPESARTGFTKQRSLATQSRDQRQLWSAYMSYAWFEDELSEHRASIEHSNKALEVATKLKDPFMIGRSLCWLGWAYSGLGLYEAAITFYEKAVEIGAPKGEIKFAHVWGLATQELGALKAKAGDLSGGRELLQRTYSYATEHSIDVGIAEGGAHLAEIALLQGRFSEASEFAERAVEAAKRCKCSPYNMTRARLVALKSQLERAHFAPERAIGLTSQLEILQEDCAKLRHRRCVAEVKLLRSQLLRSDEYQRRRELVSEAFEELAERESELRGKAEGELGRVFLQSNQLQLAKFYLQNGVEVSERLLREVDRAHLSGDLATLEGMQGDVRAQVDTLLNVIADAEKSGMLPLVLQKRLELIKVLQTAGYNQAALEQIDSTVSVFERLRAANPKGASEEAHFERQQLLLAEQRLTLAISLTREAEVP